MLINLWPVGQNWGRTDSIDLTGFFFPETFLATTVFYQRDSISGELLSVFNHSLNTDTQKSFSNAPLELGGFPVLTQHQSCQITANPQIKNVSL